MSLKTVNKIKNTIALMYVVLPISLFAYIIFDIFAKQF